MFIHRTCPLNGEGCFCEHIKEFDLKLTMISEGKPLRELKTDNLWSSMITCSYLSFIILYLRLMAKEIPKYPENVA